MRGVESVRDFLLLDEIGNGGMGTIHRAVHRPSGLPVALKLLHPHLAKDESFVTRFQREASTVALLRHENVVSVVDHGQFEDHEGSHSFIAFELVDGCDLDTVLSTVERPGAAASISIACDVLRGLAHAHEHGVIHRDMKPGNVLIGRDGRAKIADFSIAYDARGASLTLTGAVLGTPGYMSPEQLEARPLDGRTDVFSTGVALYQMLCGRRPFEGDGFVAVMREVLTSIPRDIRTVDPGVPASLARVVRIALEKEPAKRFATAGEFERELMKAAAEAGIAPSHEAVASLLVSAPMHRQLHSTPGVGTVSKAAARAAKSRIGTAVRARPGILAALAIAVVLGIFSIVLPGGRTANAITGLPPHAAPNSPAARDAADAQGPPIEAWLSSLDATGTRDARATSAPRRVVDPGGRIVDPESRQTGMVKLTVRPWAEVYVDNRFVAITPIAPLELTAGAHQIRFVHPTFGTRTENVIVVPDRTTERILDFRVR